MTTKNKIILTIAGSDSSGGAGIQADIKTFSALETYAASVITATTAQNTHTVTDIAHIPVHNIEQQLECVLSDLEVVAIKIGMLISSSAIQVVAEKLAKMSIPVVLDPVMISRTGCAVAPEACTALKEVMMPHATILTPNAPEAAWLLGVEEAKTEQDLVDQGQQLLAFGIPAVVMKGGHLDTEVCTDVLLQQNKGPICFRHLVFKPSTPTVRVVLIRRRWRPFWKGFNIEQSVQFAHDYLYQAVVHADALHIGTGHGPTHHFHAAWS